MRRKEMGEWEKEMRAKLKRTKLCNKERERGERITWRAMDITWAFALHCLRINRVEGEGEKERERESGKGRTRRIRVEKWRSQRKRKREWSCHLVNDHRRRAREIETSSEYKWWGIFISVFLAAAAVVLELWNSGTSTADDDAVGAAGGTKTIVVCLAINWID